MVRLSWFPVRLIEPVAAGAISIGSVLETASRFGFKHLEVHHSWLHLLSRRELCDWGMMVSQVTGAPDLANPDLVNRQVELESLRRTLDRAMSLEAPTVRVTAGWSRPRVPPGEALRLAADALAMVGVEASRLGVTACLENHLRDRLWPGDAVDITADPPTFFALCDVLEGSEIMVNYDSGQPLAVETDELELLNRVLPRVRSVHLGDRRRGERMHRVIGEGDVRVGAVLIRLRTAGYAGFVALEDGSIEGDPGLARSAAFVRARIADSWGQAV